MKNNKSQNFNKIIDIEIGYSLFYYIYRHSKADTHFQTMDSVLTVLLKEPVKYVDAYLSLLEYRGRYIRVYQDAVTFRLYLYYISIYEKS